MNCAQTDSRATWHSAPSGWPRGYEDLIDHEQLRSDPLFGVLAGRRELDEPLAGKSALNRLGLKGSAWAEAQVDTIRLKLLKIGAVRKFPSSATMLSSESKTGVKTGPNQMENTPIPVSKPFRQTVVNRW
jgi:hypothetical protein